MKEFKIIEEKRLKPYEKTEGLLQEKSAESWGIVSISTDETKSKEQDSPFGCPVLLGCRNI